MTAEVIRDARELERVAARAMRADVVAVDVEGNGLFAYRARLCTVQLAWRAPELEIAIVDALAVDVAILAELLGERGPVKLLHDLTFDARMLEEAGARLARVRDTSVTARFLGRKSTGLAALLASELGATVTKDLQQHDWSRRPLQPAHLAYLRADVEHLEALDAKLSEEAARLGIVDEVADECAYKLATALAGPADRGPAWQRVKGVEALDGPGRACLRELVDARERIAAAWDVPPFKVIGNDVLLAWAASRPAGTSALAATRGVSGRVRAALPELAAALARGVAARDVPADERAERPRPDRTRMAARRARENRLTKWRRAEAAARGVDEQAVLPGHCLQDLAELAPSSVAQLREVAGLGEARLARYGAHLLALVPEPEPAGAAP